MATNKKRLTRSKESKVLGVCSGIADYFDIDVTLVRLGWIVVTVFTGFVPGIVAYVVAALVMPEA
jgi:phage shock protein C